jgi:hypothetical protein
MKLEIVTGINEVQLLDERINATFVCPRKNEVVVIRGERYFVRDLIHIYGRLEQTLKIFVEPE